MNIFILDRDPVKAAQLACDKHVVKMVLESAQMLSTISGGKYKPTHVNHPCAVWARTNKSNYNWLVTHAVALGNEYTKRYGKIHKSMEVIEQASKFSNLPDGKLTEFVQTMPNEYMNNDPVLAYRAFYRGDKAKFAKWKEGNKPDWM